MEKSCIGWIKCTCIDCFVKIPENYIPTEDDGGWPGKDGWMFALEAESLVRVAGAGEVNEYV